MKKLSYSSSLALAKKSYRLLVLGGNRALLGGNKMHFYFGRNELINKHRWVGRSVG